MKEEKSHKMVDSSEFSTVIHWLKAPRDHNRNWMNTVFLNKQTILRILKLFWNFILLHLHIYTFYILP